MILKYLGDDSKYNMFSQDEGGGLITALPSGDKYRYNDEFTNAQMAIAGAMMTAILIATAGFDSRAVFRNLGIFAKTVPNRRTSGSQEWGGI